jgi:hypothetical protein
MTWKISQKFSRCMRSRRRHERIRTRMLAELSAWKIVEYCRPSLGRRYISDLINHQVWSRATCPLLAGGRLPPKTPFLQVAEMSKEYTPSYSTKNPHLASAAPRYAIVLTSIVSLILASNNNFSGSGTRPIPLQHLESGTHSH